MIYSKYRVKYNNDKNMYRAECRVLFYDWSDKNFLYLLCICPILGQILLISAFFSWVDLGSYKKTKEEAFMDMAKYIIDQKIKNHNKSINKTIYFKDNFTLTKG